ncbi:unnamed protein product, partial [Closterium sp. NIES-53]
MLLESFEPVKGEFQFATAITTSKEEELQAFFDDAVNHSSPCVAMLSAITTCKEEELQAFFDDAVNHRWGAGLVGNYGGERVTVNL